MRGARQVAATLGDGSQREAEVIGDKSDTDLAVARVCANDSTTAPLSDSPEVHVGQLVVADRHSIRVSTHHHRGGGGALGGTLHS